MEFAPIQKRRPRAPNAGLDYLMLVARLNATQSATAPAPVEAEAQAGTAQGGDAFIALIEGGPEWKRAILGQAGSFNREIAERESVDPGPA